MNARFRICWGNQEIGKVVLSQYNVSLLTKKWSQPNTFPFIMGEVKRYIFSRRIPSTRNPMWCFPALMQVPKREASIRHYDVIYVLELMSYFCSLTDKLWLTPDDDFTVSLSSEYHSHFREQVVRPCDSYQEIDFWENCFSHDVGDVLGWNYFRGDFDFHDLE